MDLTAIDGGFFVSVWIHHQSIIDVLVIRKNDVESVQAVESREKKVMDLSRRAWTLHFVEATNGV